MCFHMAGFPRGSSCNVDSNVTECVSGASCEGGECKCNLAVSHDAGLRCGQLTVARHMYIVQFCTSAVCVAFPLQYVYIMFPHASCMHCVSVVCVPTLALCTPVVWTVCCMLSSCQWLRVDCVWYLSWCTRCADIKLHCLSARCFQFSMPTFPSCMLVQITQYILSKHCQCCTPWQMCYQL